VSSGDIGNFAADGNLELASDDFASSRMWDQGDPAKDILGKG
jgi:hypothetical protein